MVGRRPGAHLSKEAAVADKQTYALVTGPISGTVPISHKKFPDGEVDVTPDILTFDTLAEVKAVGAAIGKAHKEAGTGPFREPEEEES
jgi:hypothetical protein